MLKQMRLLACGVAALLSVGVAAGTLWAAGDPGAYVKKTTWVETMLASRAAPKSGAGFKPFISEAMRGEQAAQKITVDVSGCDELWLIAESAGDGRGRDRNIGVWAEARLIGKDGKATPVRPNYVQLNGRHLITNKNLESKPLVIGTQEYATGLCSLATYKLRVDLGKKYERFEASIGIEGQAGKGGNVVFRVLDRADSREVWGRIEADFPREADWVNQDAGNEAAKWLETDRSAELEKKMIGKVLAELGESGKAFAAELEQLVKASAPANDPRWLTLYARACTARRTARLAPLAAKWPRVVFTKHHNMGGSHYAYTEAQSDGQAERTYTPGTALCMLDLTGGEAKVTTLIEDAKGVIRDPDVSLDGKRILFAWKKSDREDDYHIYEMEVASGKVRQITNGLGYADYECQYLPDGDIVFNSTRVVQTVDCWNPEVSNIYTCDKDGKYLRRLGFDQVHTNFPTVMEDGRVVYTRWEYNDRGQVFVQGLMQMNPDGTGQTEFYGMNSWFPTTLLHARNIPNSHKLVAIASGHHSRQTGKLCIVDNVKGRQENSGIQLVAPVRETEAVKVDSYGQEGDLFQYPYALDEKNYLVTYTPHGWSRQPTLFGVYFMDSEGRRELLASDPKMSCNQSIPLAARKQPVVRPSLVDYRKNTGTYYMQDVYVGPGLAGVPRGTIKKLRVIALEYRLALVGGNGNGGPAGGAFVATPVATGNGTWDPKIVIGDATVHEDGSAFFEVPARTPLYFQAIDEKGYMVQSMRSWSTLQPGENAACVGCHEDKNSSPVISRKTTYALSRVPEKLTPFYGPARGFAYPKEVQPILDRHCVSCHKNRELRPGKVRVVSASSTEWTSAKAIAPIEAQWQYTTTNPGNGWQKAGFDASKWKSGKGGFGTQGTPGGKIASEWNTGDIWLRRTFELPADLKGGRFAIWSSHDEDVEVYINGEMAVCETGHISDFRAFTMTPESLKAMKAGTNVMAVHCHQTSGGQFVDVGLLMNDKTPAVAAPGAVATAKDAFSLLSAEVVDKHAKRKWSDSYLALTGSYPFDADSRDAARGHPNELVTWIHAQSTPPIQAPYTTGAAKSRLMTLLEQGHGNVKLSREEMEKIACWIDLAVPFCGDYTDANAWTPTDWNNHNRLLKKRTAQEELERKAIEEYIRDRQQVVPVTAAAK